MSADVEVYRQASLDDRMNYARVIATAGNLVPAGLRDGNAMNPGKVLMAMEQAVVLGFHPMVGVNNINVIDGKVSIPPSLMQAAVRNAGHKLRISKTGTVEGGDYAVTATLVRSDDPDAPFTATWTPQRAHRAGLCTYVQEDGHWVVKATSQSGKALPWQNYTEAMCKARAISEVVMEGATDVMMGSVYTPEELGAMVNEQGEVITTHPGNVIDQQPAVHTAAIATDNQVDLEPILQRLEACADATEVRALWTEVQGAGLLNAVVDTIPETGETLTLRQAMLSRVEMLNLRANALNEEQPEQATAEPDQATAAAQGTLESVLDAEVVEGGVTHDGDTA